jgi:DNA-directed RNA polymerase specialized sigma24 family protein
MARKVFLCWYEENLTADETAERLGLDVAVVRWQYMIMNSTADEMDEKGEGLP